MSDSPFGVMKSAQEVSKIMKKAAKVLSYSIGFSFQCGGAYTAKLEGMLNDFILAEVMNKDFQPDFATWREKEENQDLVRLNCVRDIRNGSYAVTFQYLFTPLSRCFLQSLNLRSK